MVDMDDELVVYLHHGRAERIPHTAVPSFLDSQEFIEYNNTGGPRHVPGIHIAINFERLPYVQFSHGFGMWKQERLSRSELDMMQLMNDITDEADWFSRLDDFATVTRWKELALSRYFPNHRLWDWCLHELRKKSRDYAEAPGSILALDSASQICKSDRLRSTERFQVLSRHARQGKISPWLYPFKFGASPIRTDATSVTLLNVPECIGGATVPPRPFWDSDRWSGEPRYYSKTSQWLATDVKFTATGSSVNIISPINNLHPTNEPLYEAIESLISESVSDWDKVLLYKCLQRNGPRVRPRRGLCNSCLHNKPRKMCMCRIEFNDFAEWEQGYVGPGSLEAPTTEEWSARAAMDGAYTNSKSLYSTIDLRQAFAERGLQVYVELSSVELNADGSIPGESKIRMEWNLNGNRNERIVATTLVCIDRDNITEQSGQIQFRTETKFGSWESKPIKTGKKARRSSASGDPVLARPRRARFQQLGHITLPEGRIVTFPNTLQHRFRPLTLIDNSRPGKLQFLAIHLADPHYILCSTRHVPPQSLVWWWESARLSYICRRFGVPMDMRDDFLKIAIGPGCGHSLRDDEDNAGLGPDNTPEVGQEERPIRLEAATRMRDKAFADHATVLKILNGVRIYGVPRHLLVWHRSKSPLTAPLDQSDPAEAGCPAVNAAYGMEDQLLIAPDEVENEDELSSDDDDDDDDQQGQTTQAQVTQAQAAQAQAAQAQTGQALAVQGHTLQGPVANGTISNVQAPHAQAQIGQAAAVQDNSIQGPVPSGITSNTQAPQTRAPPPVPAPHGPPPPDQPNHAVSCDIPQASGSQDASLQDNSFNAGTSETSQSQDSHSENNSLARDGYQASGARGNDTHYHTSNGVTSQSLGPHDHPPREHRKHQTPRLFFEETGSGSWMAEGQHGEDDIDREANDQLRREQLYADEQLNIQKWGFVSIFGTPGLVSAPLDETEQPFVGKGKRRQRSLEPDTNTETSKRQRR